MIELKCWMCAIVEGNIINLIIWLSYIDNKVIQMAMIFILYHLKNENLY